MTIQYSQLWSIQKERTHFFYSILLSLIIAFTDNYHFAYILVCVRGMITNYQWTFGLCFPYPCIIKVMVWETQKGASCKMILKFLIDNFLCICTFLNSCSTIAQETKNYLYLFFIVQEKLERPGIKNVWTYQLGKKKWQNFSNLLL